MGIQIQLRNVGPISTGSFEIADLTIFVGPNNSGKSVAAICAYAASLPEGISTLFGAASPSLTKGKGRQGLELPRWTMAEDDLGQLVASTEEALNQVLEGREDRSIRIPAELERFAKAHIDNALSVYGFRLVDELERCFGTRLRDLARRDASRNSEIVVRNPGCRWTLGIDLRKAKKPAIRRLPATRRLILSALRYLERGKKQQKERRFAIPHQIANDFTLQLTRCLFAPDFPRSAQYLPAERSGILQGHRLLAGAVLRRAPYVGVERLDMPQMSGVITDFLSNILEIDETRNRSTVYNEDALLLEKTILQGSIAIQRQDHGYPEIGYRRDKHTFPLHRVSSMVTELAPIVLYLRNLLAPGDLFIVEEPESHLHPTYQLQMARLLTDLVNRELRLLVTTHSDYFLGALSNSIRLGSLEEKVSNPGVSPVNKDRVTAYVFGKSGKTGSRMTKAEISAADGIDEEEFARVTNQLYDVTARLQEKAVRAQQSDS